MYLSNIQALAIACELPRPQLALSLELSKLGLLRKDLIFS